MALETGTNHLHVAGVLVLDPAEGAPPERPDARYRRVRAVIDARLPLVPRLRQRAVRVPLDLQRPVWVDDPDLDVDRHVRRMTVPAPGGRAELDDAVGSIMSRPLPVDRPLWEMVVVDGLAGDRTAVVARLHHAILDGVSAAGAMAAFLELAPDRSPGEDGGAEPWCPPPVPSPLAMLGYAARSLGRQSGETLDALRRGADAVVRISEQNRRLESEGTEPPPALFSAPPTSLNANVSKFRRYASLAVPLDDLELVRQSLGARLGQRHEASMPTINDVILCAVGGAVARYLAARDGAPDASLVALVPVSVRGRAAVPAQGEAADVGNYVSGMLVSLSTATPDPLERLGAVARATKVAKAQEELAGGDLLEDVTRAVPPLVISAAMHGASFLRLLERAPPFNLTVSTVVAPDVPLWWADYPVTGVFPVGPVADGFGLNVTAMTYRGTVHFGLLGCARLLCDLDDLAVLLDDAIAELVALALDLA